MRKRFTFRYLFQILLARWRPILISVLIALSLVGMLFYIVPPLYQSELVFLIKPNRGMGGEEDPYRLLELSPDESPNHITNTLIALSSSLLYRKAADEFFPKATTEEKDSLGVWMDDQISVWQLDNTSLLKLQAWSEDPYLAQNLLNRFFEFIQKDNRTAYEAVMDTTIHFLQDRLRWLRHEIGELDAVNADFLIDSRAVRSNLAYQTQWRAYRRHTQTEELLQAELEVCLYLQDYAEKTVAEGGLLPYFSIGNTHTTTSIRKYNEAWLVYDKLRNEASSDKGVLRDLSEEIAQLRQVIRRGLEAEVGTLRAELGKIRGRVSAEVDDFRTLPEKLSGAYANQRLLKAKLDVYVLLHLRLEEVQIKRVIYESNWKLIEPATFSPVPVWPPYGYILVFAVFLGLFFPLGYYLFRDLLDYRIQRKAELESYPYLRIFETVPFEEKQVDAFERMRASLFYEYKQAKVLLYTSTLPHEGKTYIARNLSISLAQAGRKVILVDADIRKATQSKELHLDQKNGLSTYLAGEDPDWKPLVFQVDACPGLSLMPCGTIPPNPSELLLGAKWENLITALRAHYDYVIIDSVPAQLVADAMISVRVADLSFYVLKKGLIDRRYLPELNGLAQKSVFSDMHLILNGFDVFPYSGFADKAGRGFIPLLFKKVESVLRRRRK